MLLSKKWCLAPTWHVPDPFRLRIGVIRRKLSIMLSRQQDEELVELFKSEALEKIEGMRRRLSELQQKIQNKEVGGPDAFPEELMDTLFVDAHGLKGIAGSMDFMEIFEMANCLKLIFKKAYEDKVIIRPNLIPPLLEGIEVCKKSLNGQKVPDYDIILEKLKKEAVSER